MSATSNAPRRHWPGIAGRVGNEAGLSRGRLAAWALAVLAALVVALSGCGQAAPEKPKPTVKEILAARASVEAEKPSQPATISTTTAPAGVSLSLYRSWGVKETAVDALGRIGEAAVPQLIAALSDADPRVRAQAGRALARIGPPAKEAVPILTQRLDDPDEDVRQAAARALGQIGPAAADAVPALVSLIESTDGRAAEASTHIPAGPPPRQ